MQILPHPGSYSKKLIKSLSMRKCPCNRPSMNQRSIKKAVKQMRRRKMLNLPLAKLVLPVDQVPRNATMKTIKLSLKIQEEFIQKRPRKSSDHADTRQHLQPTFNSIIPPAQNTPTRKANFPSKETVLSKKRQPHTLPKCLKSRSIPEARSTNRRQLNVRSLETINSRILTPL